MKIATSELESLREEVKNCHRIIKDLQNKREFVGLTYDERVLITDVARDDLDAMILAEAKLREKNT